jgi:hypothetical protein
MKNKSCRHIFLHLPKKQSIQKVRQSLFLVTPADAGIQDSHAGARGNVPLLNKTPNHGFVGFVLIAMCIVGA